MKLEKIDLTEESSLPTTIEEVEADNIGGRKPKSELVDDDIATDGPEDDDIESDGVCVRQPSSHVVTPIPMISVRVYALQ